jgi:hypothetical protein
MLQQEIATNWYSYSIIIFGLIFYSILIIIQLMMILSPKSKIVKELLIGKGADWNDHTHFKTAKGFAYADLIVIATLLILSSIGVLAGFLWGYLFLFSLGCLSIYFSILCYIIEKEYTYPNVGFVGYYTYYWGSYLYFGIAAIIISLSVLIF